MLKNFFKRLKLDTKTAKNNELVTLWISDTNELPELQFLSLKSMVLTGHNVTLYAYNKLENIPEGIKVADACKILDKSKIFKYKEGFNKGSYSGYANWFRAKLLYEKGTSWFDCDILAINNINEINNQDIIISSQINLDGTISPNNAFLRFNKWNKFLKSQLDYMEQIKDDVKHGDTGPSLLKSMMNNQYTEYFNYLTNTNFIASINYFDYKDFLEPTKKIVRKINFEDVWGFHVWNAMFRNDNMEHENAVDGFYHDLKHAILTSLNREEYIERINDIKLL